MPEERVLHSGIRADTGDYGIKLDVEEVYDVIRAGWSDNGNTATFKVVINSLVNFLWLGGLIFLTGGRWRCGPGSTTQP